MKTFRIMVTVFLALLFFWLGETTMTYLPSKIIDTPTITFLSGLAILILILSGKRR